MGISVSVRKGFDSIRSSYSYVNKIWDQKALILKILFSHGLKIYFVIEANFMGKSNFWIGLAAEPPRKIRKGLFFNREFSEITIEQIKFALCG